MRQKEWSLIHWDGEPANLFFLIAAPDTADNVHLDVLSHLSVLLMDPDFTGKLREAETVEEFKKVIEMAENEPEEEKEQTEVDANVPYVLAVTGCRPESHTRIWRQKLWSAKQKNLVIRSR